MILRQEEEGPAGAATPAESDKPSNAASAMSHDATTLTCQIFGSLEEQTRLVRVVFWSGAPFFVGEVYVVPRLISRFSLFWVSFSTN